MRVRTLIAGAAAGVLALTLTACGSSSSTSTTSTPSASASTAAVLTLQDGWAKSTDSMSADKKTMTGVFGMLKNTGSTPLTITGGSSAAGKMVQMHETVMNSSGTMQMQEAKAGFTIPAGGTFELKPGANHIMVMDLVKDLKVGDTVSIDLKTSAGTITVTAAVRAFPGGNESYNPSPSMSH